MTTDDSDYEGEEIVTFTIFRFVSTGRTVVCVGRNYAEHARELGGIIVSYPCQKFGHLCKCHRHQLMPSDQGTACQQNLCSS